MKIAKLYIKDGVKINGAHFYEYMVRIINVARASAPETTDGAIWITSANDSRHMTGSLHYENRAFDIRIHNIVGGHPVARAWVARMALALGDDYDVILESDHVHVEYQPLEEIDV